MYPRELSAQEHAWIEWLIPVEREGYRIFSEQIKSYLVLGEGRWGVNDFVLGKIGQSIDMTEGMHPTFAFGAILGEQCDVNISIHETNDIGQIEFVVSPIRAEKIPYDLKEIRRWTYSYWKPGDPCPATNTRVREVKLATVGPFSFTLAISAAQHALWLHDPGYGTNRLIPVTNFYNELMSVKEIRDPKIALDHKYLFNYLQLFSDDEFFRAFKRYNVMYKKVNIALFDDDIKKKQNPFVKAFKKYFH